MLTSEEFQGSFIVEKKGKKKKKKKKKRGGGGGGERGREKVVGKEMDVARGVMLSPGRPVHLIYHPLRAIKKVLRLYAAVTQYYLPIYTDDRPILELERLLRHPAA